MTMDRLRILIDDWTLAVLCLAVALMLTGGWLAYDAHLTDPEIETEVVTVGSWDERGAFTYGADIQRENPIFIVGERQTGDTYIASISPVLDGEYRYTHTHHDERDVSIELVLVRQAVTSDGSPFWREEELLGRGETTVASGERISAEWAVDVQQQVQRIESIEDGLGVSIGSPEVLVRAEVTSRGEDSTQRHTTQLEIDTGGDLYSVEDDGGITDEHQITTEETVVAEASPLRAYGGPGLVAGGFMLAFGLGIAWYRDLLPVTEKERERIASARMRKDLDEWITVASGAVHVNSRDVIAVVDLEGLVDLAIDTETRVLEDADTGNLYVTTPETFYLHSPPDASPAWEETIVTETDGPRGNAVLAVDQRRIDEFAKSERSGNGKHDAEQEPSSTADPA